MKITRLRANGVNGILNFDITFNPNLNFLIGINGSGKTTVLKIIVGLMTPSYQILKDVSFKYIKLECVDDKTQIEITAKKDDNTLFLELKINNEVTASNKILVPNKEVLDEYDREIFDHKFLHRYEVVRAIKNIKTPVFLGLDRRIFLKNSPTMQEMNRFDYLNSKQQKTLKNPIDISILEIQELVNNYVLEMAQQQPQLTEDFKSEILNNSISYIDTSWDKVTMLPIDSKVLKEKKESLELALQNLAIGNFRERINIFFEKFNGLNNELKAYAENKMKYRNNLEKYSSLLSQMIANNSQLERIDKRIDLSRDYQKKIAQLREPIDRLNLILSHFFAESRKKIEIQPNGEFEITLEDGSKSTLFELSSGEKQILIMITHLIFYQDRRSPGVFIIDEPELSLHLGWQEIFVNSIKDASPNTQFILATHAPTIIGGLENEQFCIDIKK
jgi:predicted ATP-binding protein involved in virulence